MPRSQYTKLCKVVFFFGLVLDTVILLKCRRKQSDVIRLSAVSCSRVNEKGEKETCHFSRLSNYAEAGRNKLSQINPLLSPPVFFSSAHFSRARIHYRIAVWTSPSTEILVLVSPAGMSFQTWSSIPWALDSQQAKRNIFLKKGYILHYKTDGIAIIYCITVIMI